MRDLVVTGFVFIAGAFTAAACVLLGLKSAGVRTVAPMTGRESLFLASFGSNETTVSDKYVRSNMGLVHAVAASGQRAVCGASLRESWGSVEVADWAREPNVCRSCDDVLMSRGRKAAS